jgi:Outer membrane protein beta-barrel domain
MKKLFGAFSFIAMWMGLSVSAMAQVDAFEAHKIYLSVGYGQEVANARFWYPKTDKYNYKYSSIGPVTLKLEYAVADELGLGLVLGYSQSTVNWTSASANGNGNQPVHYYQFDMQKLTAVARMNWHFFTDEDWDAYAGIGVGYKRSFGDFKSDDSDYLQVDFTGVPVAMSLSMGVRYYFNPKFGLFFETGMGHGYVQGGLQVKI